METPSVTFLVFPETMTCRPTSLAKVCIHLLKHTPLCFCWTESTSQSQTLDEFWWSPSLEFLPHTIGPVVRHIRQVCLADDLTHAELAQTLINAQQNAIPFDALKPQQSIIEVVTTCSKLNGREKFKHYLAHDCQPKTIKIA